MPIQHISKNNRDAFQNRTKKAGKKLLGESLSQQKIMYKALHYYIIPHLL